MAELLWGLQKSLNPQDIGRAASTSSAETSRDDKRHSQVSELPLRWPLVLQME